MKPTGFSHWTTFHIEHITEVRSRMSHKVRYIFRVTRVTRATHMKEVVVEVDRMQDKNLERRNARLEAEAAADQLDWDPDHHRLRGECYEMATTLVVKARDPKFEFDGNLDDPEECDAFLKKHEPARGVRLARALGFSGPGMREAANALMNYAQNSRAARSCRTNGSIQAAQGYESIMDRIYRYDIEPNIEAW